MLNGGKISVPLSEDDNTKSLTLFNDENDIIYKDVIVKEDNKIKINSNNGTTPTYKFDTNGNAIKKYQGNKEVASFEYDNLNRLIRSNQLVINETILYEYDYNDNLVTEKHYKYTEDDKLPTELITCNTYQYTDNNWKDLLTTYNGQEITYDEIGNPIQYLDGMKFTWDSGQQLSKINMDEDEITYSYNFD